MNMNAYVAKIGNGYDADVLRFVLDARSSDTSREELQFVSVETLPNGKRAAVASDGKRLHVGIIQDQGLLPDKDGTYDAWIIQEKCNEEDEDENGYPILDYHDEEHVVWEPIECGSYPEWRSIIGVKDYDLPQAEGEWIMCDASTINFGGRERIFSALAEANATMINPKYVRKIPGSLFVRKCKDNHEPVHFISSFSIYQETGISKFQCLAVIMPIRKS